MQHWLILVVVLFISTSSHAQDATNTLPVTGAPTPTTVPLSPPKVDKIVVTGSYIRKTVDADSPTPITQIDNTNAQEAATFSMGGMLNDSAITSTSNGGNNVSFHGQSSANNLILVNGMRLPKPGGGDSADLDFIPASAVERVEILKDGASALYGSEALAGVVNIITKKEYEGANISFRHTYPEIGVGQESNVVATYGKNFTRGNLLAVVQFRRNEPYMYSDTEYGIKDVKVGGSQASTPGNLARSGSNDRYRGAACPADRVSSNGACMYDYYRTQALGQERNNYNFLLSGGYDLGSNLRLETATVYTHQMSDLLNTPVLIQFEDLSAAGGKDFSVDENVVNGWAGDIVKSSDGSAAGSVPAGKYNLSYSADEELGVKKSTGTLDALMTQLKIGQQTDTIDWDFSLGYSFSNFKEEVTSGNANKDIMLAKLKDGSWRPFKEGDKGSLADAMIDTWTRNFADVWNARLVTSGRVLNLGDKSVYAAVGLEGQLQKYSFRVDDYSLQDLALTGLGSDQDGDRNVSSAFVELTQNPVKRLQLQLAARFDKYSDFGSTVNPKIAAAYKFNDAVSMRSSYGTGFKAPDLRSLYQGNLSRSARISDEFFCRTNRRDPRCNALHQTVSYGDKNLDAEIGRHFNVGLQLNPTKKLNISVDHWRIEGSSALRSVDLNMLTRAEVLYGADRIRDLGVTINRNADNEITSIVYPLRVNSGTYATNGIDVDVRYKTQFNKWGLGPTNLIFKSEHSHILGSKQKTFFFEPESHALDNSWKNVTSVSLSRGSHLGSWRLRTFSFNDKDTRRSATSTGAGSVPTYTEHDLHYEYYGAWNGVITFGIRNIFDYKTYNDATPGRLFPASVTSLGRTFYAGYSQDF